MQPVEPRPGAIGSSDPRRGHLSLSGGRSLSSDPCVTSPRATSNGRASPPPDPPPGDSRRWDVERRPPPVAPLRHGGREPSAGGRRPLQPSGRYRWSPCCWLTISLTRSRRRRAEIWAFLALLGIDFALAPVVGGGWWILCSERAGPGGSAHPVVRRGLPRLVAVQPLLTQALGLLNYGSYPWSAPSPSRCRSRWGWWRSGPQGIWNRCVASWPTRPWRRRGNASTRSFAIPWKTVSPPSLSWRTGQPSWWWRSASRQPRGCARRSRAPGKRCRGPTAGNELAKPLVPRRAGDHRHPVGGGRHCHRSGKCGHS